MSISRTPRLALGAWFVLAACSAGGGDARETGTSGAAPTAVPRLSYAAGTNATWSDGKSVETACAASSDPAADRDACCAEGFRAVGERRRDAVVCLEDAPSGRTLYLVDSMGSQSDTGEAYVGDCFTTDAGGTRDYRPCCAEGFVPVASDINGRYDIVCLSEG